jgi:3-hydroxyisobutyrate dehydrogenase-like beta-hydroxyacid dehydrogenase
MAPNIPVCFIGLGALGQPMAANLLAAGVPLTVHNRSPERQQPLQTAGARVAGSPAEAAASAQIHALCLTDAAAVEAVLHGASGLLAGAEPGGLIIDFSTIDPARTQRLAAEAAQRGLSWLDAPVTGGTEGARLGTLSVLVGGEASDLERARPVLEVVGSTITHLGPLGSGQRAKAVNQVLVAGCYAAVAEALALGQRLGLPMRDLVAALQEGAAGSWALRHRAPNMLEGQFPLGFKLELHRKDLGIALAAAQGCELQLPITEQVAAMEDSLMQQGHGQEDVSALLRWFTDDSPPAPCG